jgi:hypothetical protein
LFPRVGVEISYVCSRTLIQKANDLDAILKLDEGTDLVSRTIIVKYLRELSAEYKA